MNFRKSEVEDIERIMEMVRSAQEGLKDQGIDQWQNGYPNSKTIKKDIDKGESYVLIDGGDIVASTALSFRGEVTYGRIYEGKWLGDGAYGVIHRIVVDRDLKNKGLASIMLDRIEDIAREKDIFSIRIDTHRKNMAMKKFLEKNDFKYCGIIYLKDGDERLAFEKILKD